MRPPLVTPKAELTWSPDGATVTKRFMPLPHDRLLGANQLAFANEARVNGLLRDVPPPVPTPALLAVERVRRALTFEAIDGEPLGPKFPGRLGDAEGEELVGLATAMERYRPRRRWLRRFPLERRLRLHVAAGVLTSRGADAIRSAAAPDLSRWSFAHGDITARNVLRCRDGRLVLIDWEWAGLHPPLYDLAFLWFSLAQVEEARHRAAAVVPDGQRRRFLVSVVLIELLHLDMWAGRGRPPTPFETQHAEQHRRDLEELRALVSTML